MSWILKDFKLIIWPWYRSKQAIISVNVHERVTALILLSFFIWFMWVEMLFFWAASVLCGFLSPGGQEEYVLSYEPVIQQEGKTGAGAAPAVYPSIPVFNFTVIHASIFIPIPRGSRCISPLFCQWITPAPSSSSVQWRIGSTTTWSPNSRTSLVPACRVSPVSSSLKHRES